MHLSRIAMVAVVASATVGLPRFASAQWPIKPAPESQGFDPSRVLTVLDESTRSGEPQAAGPFLGLATPLTADPSSGAASSSIPIELPAGRNGMTPSVAVSYSSSGGNGLFGVGWNLSLGQVRRCTRDGVPFLYDATTDLAKQFSYPLPTDEIPGDFILEMNGAQIRLDRYLGNQGLPAGYYAYGSFAEEAFLRVWFNPTANIFVVTDKSGVKYTFGGPAPGQTGSGPPQSRTGADVTTARQTFSWGLTSVEDPNGNTIAVTYATLGLSASHNATSTRSASTTAPTLPPARRISSA